eukprot:m.122387 g.122387  ORF g.122387 m.122387 type:complete len:343 (-) comp13730_c0_seq1:385-1413(-)
MAETEEKRWKNTFYLVRHGESQANQAKLIISGTEGVTGYGLTAKGKRQARLAGENLRTDLHESNQVEENFVLLSSDFLRAKETAQIIAEAVGYGTPNFDERLRERYFGELDQGPNNHYHDVWAQDALDSSHTKFAVESCDSVLVRTSGLILELEEKYNGKTFVLVAHGDTLQILQTWFVGCPASQHRDLPSLGTAEIRKMVLQGLPFACKQELASHPRGLPMVTSLAPGSSETLSDAIPSPSDYRKGFAKVLCSGDTTREATRAPTPASSEAGSHVACSPGPAHRSQRSIPQSSRRLASQGHSGVPPPSSSDSSSSLSLETAVSISVVGVGLAAAVAFMLRK